MATSKKAEVAETTEARSTQDINFDNARKTAQVNHDANVLENENSVGGYDGVEVRPLEQVEVINPVRNNATGELEDDTRTIKLSDKEAVSGSDSEVTSEEDK